MLLDALPVLSQHRPIWVASAGAVLLASVAAVVIGALVFLRYIG